MTVLNFGDRAERLAIVSPATLKMFRALDLLLQANRLEIDAQNLRAEAAILQGESLRESDRHAG